VTSYSGQHKRVVRARGPANARRCTGCPATARDWALIHGRDAEDPASYTPMCRSCHNRYDGVGDPSIGQRRGAQQRAKDRCPQQHEYTPENTYLVGPTQRRQCKTCTLGHSPR